MPPGRDLCCEGRLRMLPADPDLVIAEPDHRVAELPGGKIAAPVLLVICGCRVMGGTVALDDQRPADQQVHSAYARNVNLAAGRHVSALEKQPNPRLASGAGPRPQMPDAPSLLRRGRAEQPFGVGQVDQFPLESRFENYECSLSIVPVNHLGQAVLK